jgi:hypothetical protein
MPESSSTTGCARPDGILWTSRRSSPRSQWDGPLVASPIRGRTIGVKCFAQRMAMRYRRSGRLCPARPTWTPARCHRGQEEGHPSLRCEAASAPVCQAAQGSLHLSHQRRTHLFLGLPERRRPHRQLVLLPPGHGASGGDARFAQAARDHRDPGLLHPPGRNTAASVLSERGYAGARPRARTRQPTNATVPFMAHGRPHSPISTRCTSA